MAHISGAAKNAAVAVVGLSALVGCGKSESNPATKVDGTTPTTAIATGTDNVALPLAEIPAPDASIRGATHGQAHATDRSAVLPSRTLIDPATGSYLERIDQSPSRVEVEQAIRFAQHLLANDSYQPTAGEVRQHLNLRVAEMQEVVRYMQNHPNLHGDLNSLAERCSDPQLLRGYLSFGHDPARQRLESIAFAREIKDILTNPERGLTPSQRIEAVEAKFAGAPGMTGVPPRIMSEFLQNYADLPAVREAQRVVEAVAAASRGEGVDIAQLAASLHGLPAEDLRAVRQHADAMLGGEGALNDALRSMLQDHRAAHSLFSGYNPHASAQLFEMACQELGNRDSRLLMALLATTDERQLAQIASVWYDMQGAKGSPLTGEQKTKAFVSHLRGEFAAVGTEQRTALENQLALSHRQRTLEHSDLLADMEKLGGRATALSIIDGGATGADLANDLYAALHGQAPDARTMMHIARVSTQDQLLRLQYEYDVAHGPEDAWFVGGSQLQRDLEKLTAYPDSNVQQAAWVLALRLQGENPIALAERIKSNPAEALALANYTVAVTADVPENQQRRLGTVEAVEGLLAAEGIDLVAYVTPHLPPQQLLDVVIATHTAEAIAVNSFIAADQGVQFINWARWAGHTTREMTDYAYQAHFGQPVVAALDGAFTAPQRLEGVMTWEGLPSLVSDEQLITPDLSLSAAVTAFTANHGAHPLRVATLQGASPEGVETIAKTLYPEALSPALDLMVKMGSEESTEQDVVEILSALDPQTRTEAVLIYDNTSEYGVGAFAQQCRARGWSEVLGLVAE